MLQFSLLLALLATSGCSQLINQQAQRFADNINTAITQNRDVATVAQASPTFLVLMDSLIAGAPEDPGLLRQGATLYSAYGGLFVDEPLRKQYLANRAFGYAREAACLEYTTLCDPQKLSLEALQTGLDRLDDDAVATLYTLGSSWFNWIQANSSDWNAVAELPRAEQVLLRVIELAPDYDCGNSHLYLGALYTLVPAALGGQPEAGRAQFEQALRYCDGNNQMARVVYAERYARSVFDRELHTELLTRVMATPVDATPALTLSNAIARERAAKLLADEADYFF